MKRAMYVGFGVVLICTACVLHFHGNASDSGLRVVTDSEASLVIGGGEQGSKYDWVKNQCGGLEYCPANVGGYIGSNEESGNNRADPPTPCGSDRTCGTSVASTSVVGE